jgi:hypothetical protein
MAGQFVWRCALDECQSSDRTPQYCEERLYETECVLYVVCYERRTGNGLNTRLVKPELCFVTAYWPYQSYSCVFRLNHSC